MPAVPLGPPALTPPPGRAPRLPARSPPSPAALALIPPGAVSHGLYDVIRAISAVFPFRASLQAVDGALNDTEPGVWESLAHLAALVAGYGILARVALRRFG